MGSVERVLVLGIVVVIVAILGITIWGAAGEEAGAVLPATDGGVVATAPATTDVMGLPLAEGDGTTPAPVSEIARWRQLREAEAKARGETVGNEPPLVAGGADAATQGNAPVASATPGAAPGPAGGPAGGTGAGVPLESNVTVQPVAGAGSTPVIPYIKAENPVKAAATPGTYTVVAGDSLWKIAHRVYGDANIQEHIDAILAANPKVDAGNLQIGARLTLPGKDGKDVSRQPAAKQVEALNGTLYEVKKGDTLSGIARAQLGSETRWKQIYELNRERIQDPGNIKIGTTLRLPKN